MAKEDVVLVKACSENDDKTVTSSLKSTNIKSFINSKVAAKKVPGLKPDVEFTTALNQACGYSTVDIVKQLVHNGADVNIRDGWDETPLHRACFSKIDRVEKVTFLLSLGTVEVDARNDLQNLPIHFAALYGGDEIIAILVNHGAGVNAKGQYGHTPVHSAALKGHVKVIKQLVKNNAEINSKDEDGNLPLHVAASKGRLECVALFVETYHTDVNSKTNFGNTPLHLAARKGHLNAVKYITLNFTCDITITNNLGKTALHYAAEGGHLGVVKSLTTNDSCLINVTDHDGNTPLHHAAAEGHLGVISYLISLPSCGISAKNNASKTAMDLAQKNKHSHVQKYLLKYELETKREVMELQKQLAKTDPGKSKFGFIKIASELFNGSKKNPAEKRSDSAQDIEAGEQVNPVEAVKERVSTTEETSTVNIAACSEEFYRKKKDLPLVYAVKDDVSEPRGFAVIINITKDRSGASVDEELMTSLFHNLNYQVHAQKDKTKQEILKHLKDISVDEQLPNHDSIVLFFMAHGQSEQIFDVEDEPIYYHDLFEIFQNTSCPGLEGKPKLFFFQSCRGVRKDYHVKKESSEGCETGEETDDRTTEFIPVTSRHSDMLMSYATVPGHYAFRDRRLGSRYPKAISEIFSKHTADMHVLDMLSMVNAYMHDLHNLGAYQFDVKSRTTKVPIQCAEMTSTLTKQFYFFPRKT